MTYFDCDYSMGAHPEVLEALTRDNLGHTPGYGLDAYSEEARALILQACGLTPRQADVFFTVGGTQTNAVALSWLLAPGEGVISTDMGHINVHEAGAIEATGHKVITLPARDGLLSADDLEAYLRSFYGDDTWPHMVRPRAVYITFPSEIGTLYSLHEMERLAAICRQYGLALYLDGARLAYGLAAQHDVTLCDIARLCDAFYIGGTKCGTLMGEALVVKYGPMCHPEGVMSDEPDMSDTSDKSDESDMSHIGGAFDTGEMAWCRQWRERRVRPALFSHIKLCGALLAKGRLLGLQFRALFSDNLYYDIGHTGIETAQRLCKIMAAAGYPPALPSTTNQQFFNLPNALIDALEAQGIVMELWGPRNDAGPGALSMVRMVTSWATTPDDIKALATALASPR